MLWEDAQLYSCTLYSYAVLINPDNLNLASIRALLNQIYRLLSWQTFSLVKGKARVELINNWNINDGSDPAFIAMQCTI